MRRVRTFIERNGELRRHILAELRHNDPLPLSHFENRAARWLAVARMEDRTESSQMLEFLGAEGELMVAAPRERFWDLAARCLPKWTPRERLSKREVGR